MYKKLPRVSRMIARVGSEIATTPSTLAAVKAAFRARQVETDRDLAKLIGVSRGSIGNYKHGRIAPPLDVAVALAAHFKMDLEHFAGASPLPSRSPELTQALLAVRELATAQGGIANRLQDVAELLSHLEGPVVDDQAAATG